MEIKLEKIGKEQDKYLLSLEKGKEVWCTEEKLKPILNFIFRTEIITNKKIILNERTFFPDYRIPDKSIVVEFQGYQHYTSSKQVFNDFLRKQIFNSNGWVFIEFPYFIQPSKQFLEFLFPDVEKEKIKDFSNGYPHGFVHPKSVVIGDFCILGLEKVKEFFKLIPKNIVEDCFKSLEVRSKKDNVPYKVYNPLLLEI